MFRSWRTEPLFWIAIRAVVGSLWIYFGAEKLFRLPAFAESVENYQILTRPWTDAVAVLVPWLEIVIGVAILLRLAYTGALTISSGLLLVFIGALAQAWARGLDISCGCTPWSAEGKTNYGLGIGINVAWLLLTLMMTYGELTRPRHRFRGRKLKLS